MAADLGVKVDVFESQEEADSASRDSFRDQEDQGSRDGLFRRKKNKQGDEKKSKKPPGRTLTFLGKGNIPKNTLRCTQVFINLGSPCIPEPWLISVRFTDHTL